MRTKLFILGLLGILAIGCSRKVAPTISLPTEKNPCNDKIQALLDSITEVEPVYIYETVYENGIEKTDTIRITDTSNCNYYKVAALDMAKKYNTAIQERDFYKTLAQTQAKKIINNTYINSKNKNSQVGDGNQASKSGTNQSGTGNVNQEAKKGPAQNGNDNEAVFKPNKSATGEGSSVDNSKKGSIWPWIMVGAASWIIIQNLLWPLAKNYIPFANIAFKSKNIIKKLWS